MAARDGGIFQRVQRITGTAHGCRESIGTGKPADGALRENHRAYEVNEAFAPVPMVWQAAFDADPAKLNPRGGAIALGHPLGASGTRLMTTLVNHLEATGGRFGLQTMCEGAGMANATLIERV